MLSGKETVGKREEHMRLWIYRYGLLAALVFTAGAGLKWG
jgi:hypothetical protein